MPDRKISPRARFLHATQITRNSSARNPVPGQCETTAVRRGQVYYKNSTGFRSVTGLEGFEERTVRERTGPEPEAGERDMTASDYLPPGADMPRPEILNLQSIDCPGTAGEMIAHRASVPASTQGTGRRSGRTWLSTVRVTRYSFRAENCATAGTASCTRTLAAGQRWR